MRLTITEIQEADYGEYKCVAKNPRGETDGNIKIYGKWVTVVMLSEQTRILYFNWAHARLYPYV